MANVSRPDSVLRLTGFPPDVKNVPAVWPSTPAPGKISLLWKYNSNDIYHKFSPYTDGENPFGIIRNKQPFIYRWIDKAQESKFNELSPQVKAIASTVNLTQDTVDDVVRVSKWLLTGRGIQYNVKQLVLQNANSFDETRIYNPISPVVAALSPFTLGTIRPMRHLEGGSTPNSTVGDFALGREAEGDGKGLPRGNGASLAYSRLQSKWPTPTGGGGVFGNSLGGSLLRGITSFAVGVMGTTPKQPTGTKVRADEATYTAMAYNSSGGGKLSWSALGLSDIPAYQFTSAPAEVTIGNPKHNKSLFDQIANVSSRVMSYVRNPLSLAGDALSSLLGGGRGSMQFPRAIWSPLYFPDQLRHESTIQLLQGSGIVGPDINGSATGFDYPADSKYEDVIKISAPGTFTNSKIVMHYAQWKQDQYHPPTKFTDGTSDRVKDLNDNLKKVISDIGKSKTYTMSVLPGINRIISSGNDNPTEDGYSRIDKMTDTRMFYKKGDKRTFGSGYTYSLKVGTSGKNNGSSVPIPVDNVFKTNNLRFSTTFTSDGINMLPVLSGDKKIVATPSLSAMYPNWTEWSPENDDLIAFYFYDVVNNKYIPFRATVKGIAEGNNAYWDELRFIGRADQLYSYNGYSRTLSFTFNVVINSIHEMLPTFKKINYLGGVVKPSNYTKSDKFGGRYSEFIVPPMYMITIGDLYKYQPVVITSLNINVPDDAQWETLNENNAKNGWSYLNGIIKSPMVGKKYAQLPKEFEIAVTCNLLEKERAIVGAAHFGHAPHGDGYKDGYYNEEGVIQEGRVFLPPPTEFSKDMVEYTEIGKYTPTTNNTP